MKKILISIILISVAGLSYAGSYDDFYNNASAENLKPFTKDASALLNSGIFTTGRILGWGGYRFGVRASYMNKPSDENTELGTDKSSLTVPWIQADIGLPLRIDGFIRTSNYHKYAITGGGFRWGVFRPSDKPGSFQMLISLAGHNSVNDYFSLTTYNASLVGSFKFDTFNPYAGVGIDYGKLQVRNVADSSLIGVSEEASTPHYTLGVNFLLWKFFEFAIAGNYANYGLGGEASLAFRF